MARVARLALLGALLLSAGSLAARAGSAHARGLTLGFNSDPVLTGDSATTRAAWIPRAAADGAGMVRVNVIWSQVAPVMRPPGFDPSVPASPGYDWTAVDAAVRDLSVHGVQVLLNITFAPAWAEGPGRPAGIRPGAWRPDPTQFALFATAAASRYDGRFPDPLRPGATLPRVRYWQAWNEPNLSIYLAPQWTQVQGGWQPASPGLYRQLLNGFYAAVKRVSPSNFVVTAGTAPYGDAPGGERMPPVEFDRDLFCLRNDSKLSPTACPDPPHLDAISHHPYGVGGPLWHALNPDDAAVPDIFKIARVLHAAERAGHVLPRGPKRLWVTEISWDSKPPNPQGVPISKQALWYEQAMYVLWRQGVDTILFLQLVDSPPVPDVFSAYEAGLYYVDGRPKPAAQAFSFPFVTRRLDRGRIQAWGRAPEAGSLLIDVRRGGRWRVVRALKVGTQQVFLATLGVRGRAVLRAQLGSQKSLAWTQGG